MEEENKQLLDRWLKYKKEEVDRMNQQNALYESWIKTQTQTANENKASQMAEALSKEIPNISFLDTPIGGALTEATLPKKSLRTFVNHSIEFFFFGIYFS